MGVYFSEGNCDFNAMGELRNLKSRIEELETDLRERDEEVKVLKEQQQAAMQTNGDQDPDAIKVYVYFPRLNLKL